jgi:hypothetical protein
MKKNIGTTDKAIRLIAGLIIVIAYFTHLISGTTAIILSVIAGILIITSFISFCPLYFPFGFSTRKKED